MGCPLGRCRWALVVLVDQPVLLWIIEGVDHFGNKLVLLGYLKHCACVLVPSTVVSGRENSEELTASESLEAVHNALVGSQDELATIGIEEVFDAIRSEFDDVTSAVRVSDEVGLDAKVLVAVSWV